MTENVERKDKKPKTLFVRGLTRIEGESGPTDRTGLGGSSSNLTTLIVGEESFEYTAA